MVLLISLMAFSVFAATYDCSIGAHDLLPEQWAARPSCGSAWAAFQCCARCDYYIQTNVKLAEHNYVDGVCEYCDDGASSSGGGTTDSGNSGGGTTDSGNSGGNDCSIYGHVKVAGKCICAICDEIVHSYENSWETVIEASCSTEGMKKRRCVTCDDYEVSTIPTYPHTWVDGSCFYCGTESDCQHEEFGSWQIETDATCTTDGKRYHICLECKIKKTESIPKLGHKYREWVNVREATCTLSGEDERTCSVCEISETRIINALGHLFADGKCEVCGSLDSSHNHFAYRVVILSENEHVYLCSCGEPYAATESHFWEEKNRTSSTANHLPMTKTVVCSDCGFERVQFFVNPVLNTHILINGERLTYSTLSSHDCLFFEYTSNNAGSCEISVVNGAGTATKITLPTLSKGEKLLVDTKTGFYSIWSDEVSKEKILVDSKYVIDNGGYYYQFAPIVESVPNPLDRVNAYFESAHLDRYDYPDNDKSKDGTGFNRPYPGTGRGSANNIMLISFPFETLQDIKNSLDEYPLYLVLYDGANVAIKSVTSTSDPFIASYVALKGSNGGTNGGSHNGGVGDMGGSYAQGYADAYNTLTNAVIEKAPIQGFIQGMWYGVLAMVTILGNGISIGGISLFSVLVSVVMVVVVYFVFKILGK